MTTEVELRKQMIGSKWIKFSITQGVKIIEPQKKKNYSRAKFPVKIVLDDFYGVNA